MGKHVQSRRSGLAQFSVPRLPCQATDHWHIACGNCGNCKFLAAAAGQRRASRLAKTLAEIAETAAMARALGIATEIGVVRKGRKGRKPIFLLYRYESIPVRSLGGKMARQADSSSAVWWANGNCRTCVLWCPLTQGRRGEALRAIRKFPIFSMRESRKPRPMVLTYSGLLRPEVPIVMRKSVHSRVKFSLEGRLDSFTRHTRETVNLTVRLEG